MKSLLLAAASLLLASTSAGAVQILIDDFNTDQGPIQDLTTGDGATVSGPQMIDVNGNMIERTISLELLASAAPVDAEIEIAGGFLDLNLGPAEDAEGRLIYGIDALSDDFDALGNLTDLALLVEIVAADGTLKTIEAILNGNSLGIFALPDLVAAGSPQTLAFDIDPNAEIGGELEFVVNGNPGYDIAFNLLGFEASPEEVPAPAMLGLFGLGLIGMAAARRRRA